MALGMDVGLGPVHIVLHGDAAFPSLERETAPPPIFCPCLLWPNGWMHQDAAWYGGRPQPRALCVRWGPSHSPKMGRSPPHFSAHVYCGKTTAWIKMPLGTEVGLGPDDIVLDGDSAALPKWGRSPLPNFRPMSIVAKRLDGSRWHLA